LPSGAEGRACGNGCGPLQPRELLDGLSGEETSSRRGQGQRRDCRCDRAAAIHVPPSRAATRSRCSTSRGGRVPDAEMSSAAACCRTCRRGTGSRNRTGASWANQPAGPASRHSRRAQRAVRPGRAGRAACSRVPLRLQARKRRVRGGTMTAVGAAAITAQTRKPRSRRRSRALTARPLPSAVNAGPTATAHGPRFGGGVSRPSAFPQGHRSLGSAEARSCTLGRVGQGDSPGRLAEADRARRAGSRR